MTRVLLALGLVLSSGCRIPLDDGAYGCVRGSCPESWFCHQDARCYREPELASDSGGDASSGDASTATDASNDADASIGPNLAARSFYSRCDDASECDSGVCALGPGASASPGQCSRTCTADSGCPASGAAAGRCVGGFCLMACTATSECDSAFGCFYDPESAKHACFAIDDADWAGKAYCNSITASCGSPSSCALGGASNLDGTCVVGCTSSEDDCPFDADCVPLPDGVSYGCISRCVNSSDCGGGNGCNAYPGATTHCVPSSWGN